MRHDNAVLVVCPNLCFDRTLWVDAFEAGTVSRPSRVVVTAGGKGVNVARTLRDLGHAPLVTGFVGDGGGERLTALLEGEGADVLPVPVAGEVRSATIIIEASARATVLNEPGPLVGEVEERALVDAVDGALSGGRHRVLVCSGSLPPGLSPEIYGRLCDVARSHGVRTVVDGAREALAATLAHRPDVVTPNLDEAEGLVSGAVVESSQNAEPVEVVRERAAAAARALVERGAVRAVVTAGSYGAVLVAGDESTWVAAPEVEVANPIGAGDSFTGGLTAALEDGREWSDAVLWAVAVAGAAVEQEQGGRVDAARAEELAARLGAEAGR